MSVIRVASRKLIDLVEDLGIFIIVVATMVAVGFELMEMVHNRRVAIGDLLLLFIYLEVLAMLAIYLDSGKLPVRMPLYIAIVALARYLILDMKNLETEQMVGIAGSALLIAITVLAIRFGHCRFPYQEEGEGKSCTSLKSEKSEL